MQFKLNNGLKLIGEQTNSDVAHIGVLILSGTRDERPQESGIAHLIEHCIFKGTKKRKAHHISNRIDNVGGELNAYTTKEKTVVYCSLPVKEINRGFELLSDIVFNATFPEKEIKKEKLVVIDEIQSYKDNPYELVYDHFEERLFQGHALGKPILGTEKSITAISGKQIQAFSNTHYQPNKMVVSVVSGLKETYLRRYINKYFSLENTQQKVLFERKPPPETNPFNESFRMNYHQAHCIIGTTAFSLFHPLKNAFALLNNILGGPALNSRLNLNIREKHGYTYNIESQYTPYTDSGVFSIYLSTERKYINKSIDLVQKELNKLKTKPLSKTQLDKAKKQLKGQLTLAKENHTALMLSKGKSVLFNLPVLTLPELFKQIDAISAQDILTAANIVFDDSKLSQLTYLPN